MRRETQREDVQLYTEMTVPASGKRKKWSIELFYCFPSFTVDLCMCLPACVDLFLPVAAASNMTTNKTERQAVCSKRPCAEHSSCSSCTQSNCMWCSNLALCIDTNAYVASFPYGQCMDWTTKQDKCNGQCGFDGGQGRMEVGGEGSRWLYYQVQLWSCVYVCVCVGGGGAVCERERGL